MDSVTLRSLLKEAEKNHTRADKAFSKHDNVEDMHESEAWALVIAWLKSKIEVTANSVA